MKKPAASLLLFPVLILLLLSSCDDITKQTITWVEFEPVYMSQEEFLNSVAQESAKDLENPGKIYFYNGYLFVNEVNEGIHIIDNRDPSSPVNVGFINIPANKDLAIRNDILYADSQKDLLIFDISDLENAELIERIEDVFNTSAEMAPGFTTQAVDPEKGLVIDWKPVVKEEICEGTCRSHPGWGFRTLASTDAMFSGGAGSEGSQSGVGGSMARFTIQGDYLYAVDHTDLITFNVTSADNTIKVDQKSLGWAIETIFPYQENLFIGSESAMYIYELSNPTSPSQLSVYLHATSCDPVVVEGDYAFVTLREGERCPRGINRLEVIDVENLTQPTKVQSYEMINPHGLGIDNGTLFVSEGEYGLKILDAANPLEIRQLRHITDIQAYDVIPLNGVLMVTGGGGIVQYDYSDLDNLRLLSTIPVYSE
ncbi:LVIVD repeat-containing protein [Rhodohalobacter mucosus]|uniref:LVIVD repeat-containing protein n=1 Tax=Rhodohalobacter mucosus TaxID=2079485 RepID=A0A316TXK6_9BACT|nr:hypothetical protein [Rhodohalobacter mucosus]PWN08189.1 hypothetical protein DDZ15_00715 [Rhodohalobacter mucosus]